MGALKEGYIQISQTVIKDYVRTQLEEERLKHAGFLLFQYVGEDPDKKSGFYKFPHLTFQEYFVRAPDLPYAALGLLQGSSLG